MGPLEDRYLIGVNLSRNQQDPGCLVLEGLVDDLHQALGVVAAGGENNDLVVDLVRPLQDPLDDLVPEVGLVITDDHGDGVVNVRGKLGGANVLMVTHLLGDLADPLGGGGLDNAVFVGKGPRDGRRGNTGPLCNALNGWFHVQSSSQVSYCYFHYRGVLN